MDLRIGFILLASKLKRSGFIGLVEYARGRSIDFVPIDLALPIAEQGPFDLIIHKITDVMGLVEKGDEQAKANMKTLLDFINAHPEVPILDPLPNVAKLLHRMSTFAALDDCLQADVAKTEDPLFYTPLCTVIESAKQDLHLMRPCPVFCKRLSACSNELAHKMILVPTPAFFAPDSPNRVDVSDGSFLLQEFINHDSIVFKVYVIHDHISITPRPSFKNLESEGAKPVYFDSQKLPISFADPADAHSATSNHNTDQLLSMLLTTADNDLLARKEAELDRNRVVDIANKIKEHLGLTMLGFDVIIESGTRRHYVIDVNYFPSFKHVPDFQRIFVDFLKSHIRPRQND